MNSGQLNNKDSLKGLLKLPFSKYLGRLGHLLTAPHHLMILSPGFTAVNLALCGNSRDVGQKEPSETTEKVGVCGRGVRQKAVGSLFFMFSPHFLSLDAHYFLSMGQIAGMTGVFLPSSCHFYLFYGSHPFQIDRYCGKHGL